MIFQILIKYYKKIHTLYILYKYIEVLKYEIIQYLGTIIYFKAYFTQIRIKVHYTLYIIHE